MRERDVEKALCDWVKKQGGKAYKWVSPGNDGVPDRIIILPGLPPIFCELKTDTGHPSQIQKKQLAYLACRGQLTCIVYGMEGVRKLRNIIVFAIDEWVHRPHTVRVFGEEVTPDEVPAARLPEESDR